MNNFIYYRDGAPIELTALLKLCVDFVANSSDFPIKEVVTSTDKKFAFKDWSILIKHHFEEYYWIPVILPPMSKVVDKELKYI